MTSKNPKTKEEWKQHWAENRELSEKVRKSMTSYIDLSDTEFKNSISEYSKEELQALMVKMRSEMTFYKKIVQEPYYVEHPEKKETQRYEEAFRKAKSINSKGKIVYSIINL